MRYFTPFFDILDIVILTTLGIAWHGSLVLELLSFLGGN